jgi:hypothetical protein
VPDALARVSLAVGVAVVVGLGLIKWRRIPRDLALTVFGVLVSVLGIFAFFGPLPAMIGGAVILGVFGVGAAVYGLISLVTRWSTD